jgi:general secretion pathway protein J
VKRTPASTRARAHRAPRREAGFTLIEVLLAVTLLAMVSTLIYGSFARTFDAIDFVEGAQGRYHDVRLALERISREISMAFIYDCREVDTPTGEETFRTLFKSERQSDADRLVFTSFGHLRMVRDSNESDQNVLTFYGEDDPEDRNVTNLMRKEKSRIDGEPEEGGQAEILCRGIESLHFEFWDETKTEWVEEWDCSQIERLNQLPKLVRITLTVLDETGKELPLTTITRIFTTKPLSVWMKPSQ